MAKFAAFLHPEYEPSGGWGDLHGCFNTFTEAKVSVERKALECAAEYTAYETYFLSVVNLDTEQEELSGQTYQHEPIENESTRAMKARGFTPTGKIVPLCIRYD